MKWILAIIAFYVWHQSRASGLPFTGQAKRDIDAILGQINQVNPPQPVLSINPLRIVTIGSSGATGGGVAPGGGFSGTFNRPFLSLRQPL